MKLTNAIRDNFIKAAMSDVPKIDYEEQAKTLAKDWIESQMKIALPGIDLAKAEPWLAQRGLSMPGSLRSLYTFAPPEYEYLRSNAKLWAKLQSLEKELQAQKIRRESLEEQLRGCAYSVGTVKALRELLPDFARYLPDEATPAKRLPATTGVVKSFRAAGWPKKSKATP